MKFCVVPESSERCTTVIGADGSVAPELSAAIFGSFQVVIVAVEDPGDRVGVELEVGDAVDVVRDGDRGDVDREVDALGAGGAALEVHRELGVLEVRRRSRRSRTRRR